MLRGGNPGSTSYGLDLDGRDWQEEIEIISSVLIYKLNFLIVDEKKGPGIDSESVA